MVDSKYDDLTERQREVLRFLQRRELSGQPAKLRCVAEFLGVGLNAAFGHVTALRKKGCVGKSDAVAGLQLTDRVASPSKVVQSLIDRIGEDFIGQLPEGIAADIRELSQAQHAN